MSDTNEYQFYQKILEETMPFNWVAKMLHKFLTDHPELNKFHWTGNQIFAFLILNFLQFTISKLNSEEVKVVENFLNSANNNLQSALELAIQTALEIDYLVIADYLFDLALRLNTFLKLDENVNTYSLYTQLWDYTNSLKTLYTEYKLQLNN